MQRRRQAERPSPSVPALDGAAVVAAVRSSLSNGGHLIRSLHEVGYPIATLMPQLADEPDTVMEQATGRDLKILLDHVWPLATASESLRDAALDDMRLAGPSDGSWCSVAVAFESFDSSHQDEIARRLQERLTDSSSVMHLSLIRTVHGLAPRSLRDRMAAPILAAVDALQPRDNGADLITWLIHDNRVSSMAIARVTGPLVIAMSNFLIAPAGHALYGALPGYVAALPDDEHGRSCRQQCVEAAVTWLTSGDPHWGTYGATVLAAAGASTHAAGVAIDGYAPPCPGWQRRPQAPWPSDTWPPSQ